MMKMLQIVIENAKNVMEMLKFRKKFSSKCDKNAPNCDENDEKMLKNVMENDEKAQNVLKMLNSIEKGDTSL